MTHNAISGVAHFAAHNDAECVAMIRELLGFLPSNNLEDPPRRVSSDPADRADASLDQLVPADARIPYDISEVIRAVADDRYFFEVQEHFAKNLVIGFARGWTAARWGSSPTSLQCSPACWTSTPRSRERASCASATPLIFRW